MAATSIQAEAELPAAAPAQMPIEARLDLSVSEDDSRDEEEEVALLPRHTKVRVVGNSRCKSSLVGQTGVVKKAVGLGGWHWLVSLLPVRLLPAYCLFLVGQDGCSDRAGQRYGIKCELDP